MKIKRSALRVGQYIMLRANKREGWRAEPAQVVGLEGNSTIMVQVASQDPEDDGIREITVEQVAGRATQRDLLAAGWSR